MLQRFDDFVTGITICYKQIQRIKSLEMTEFGLKGSHVMCIFFLHRNPEGLTASQLSQLCNEDKAAISRSLAALTEKGYIQSDEKRYRATISLTESGQKLAHFLNQTIEQMILCGGDGLTEEEREIFYRSLKLIATNLQKHLDENS